MFMVLAPRLDRDPVVRAETLILKGVEAPIMEILPILSLMASVSSSLRIPDRASMDTIG